MRKSEKILLLLVLAVSLFLLFFFIFRGVDISEYYPDLVSGFSMTMGLYLFALFLGLGLGIVLAISRHYGGPLVTRIATAFIEFERGTPLLAQVYAFTILPYALAIPTAFISWEIVLPDIYGIQRIVLDTRILLCALALGLNSAAYQAEYFRGSLSSLSAGQTLAAQSIGMTKRQEIRYVALPQSLRRVIPAWSNEAVYLPVYTCVAYFVGVAEFLSASTLVVARTYQALIVYFLTAIVFLVLVGLISWLLNHIYERIRIPGL